MLKKFDPYWVWALLALPALPMLSPLFTATGREFGHLMHPTGEWAARLMILSMLITPLMYLTKGATWARWLKKYRRNIGVAAFTYGAMHAYVYIIRSGTLEKMIGELSEVRIWTGWLALAIFVPLAVTSADWAVKALGTKWKAMQRWVYGAAVLTLIHWASLKDWGEVAPALVNFSPLIVLTIYRLWWVYLRPRPMVA